MSSGNVQIPLSTYARHTADCDLVHTYDKCSVWNYSGSEGYGGLIGLIALFVVLVIIIWLILIVWNPEWLQERDEHGHCNKKIRQRHAFGVAVVIALIIVLVVGIVGATMRR